MVMIDCIFIGEKLRPEFLRPEGRRREDDFLNFIQWEKRK